MTVIRLLTLKSWPKRALLRRVVALIKPDAGSCTTVHPTTRIRNSSSTVRPSQKIRLIWSGYFHAVSVARVKQILIDTFPGSLKKTILGHTA